MCGIVGRWFASHSTIDRAAAANALARLAHRGPDDHGIEWFDCERGAIVLGHTRLSIIDLSSAGHQPMRSPCGRWAMIYNGEIYNYRELRCELASLGERFATESDTEVLLRAWMRWGEGCLPRLVGMFAFAVLDSQNATLTVARDAFGMKPLYYASGSWGWAFGSEIKALVEVAGLRRKLNLQRAYDYLVGGLYDNAEDSFFDGVRQLPAAHVMTFSADDRQLQAPRRWWWPSIEERSVPFRDAVDRVRALFMDSIRLHLRSDVKVGAALSGGVDSSAVVCAMRLVEPDMPIHSFSFVAPGTPQDEERWVDIVNEHVGAIPHKVTATALELAGDLDDMVRAQDEPFGGTSIYAQYRVFRLAREHGIKVTLDGQGADEVLAGYNGYPGPRLSSLIEKGDLLGLCGYLSAWKQWPGRSVGEALTSLAGQLTPHSMRSFGRGLIGRSAAPSWIDADWLKERGVRFRSPSPRRSPEGRERRLAEALRTSLSGGDLQPLLRHGDRNSMRWSIESRLPFLTPPFAEYMLSLPEQYLVSSDGETKHVFKQAMRGIVPEAILSRRDKIGFATPERAWLAALEPVAERWIGNSNAVPFLRSSEIRAHTTAALSSGAGVTPQAWRFMNFYAWVQSNAIEIV